MGLREFSVQSQLVARRDQTFHPRPLYLCDEDASLVN
jgi:hypothetical protein